MAQDWRKQILRCLLSLPSPAIADEADGSHPEQHDTRGFGDDRQIETGAEGSVCMIRRCHIVAANINTAILGKV